MRVEGLPVRHVDAGGVRLAYLEVGNGSPILLVPGFTGSKEDFGPILAPLAAKGHRVVAMDQRGQLDSPGAGDAASYTPDLLAPDLLALVDALDLAPVHLVGHSFGGMVARAAVIARPAAFASLLLLDTGPAALDGQRAALMNQMRVQLVGGGGVSAVSTLLRTLAPDRPFEADRMARNATDAVLGMGEALLAEPDRVDELAAVIAAVGLPAMVACGEDDDAWPRALQQAMASRLGVPFVAIPGGTHSPAIDKPAETAAMIADFVS
jgi:pimeloyl-ACP methyl ester carboxylesterase